VQRQKPKGKIMSREAKPISRRVYPTILPEIRSLIEMSRHHAAVTANLAMVNLYWNIGRVITQDIKKNEKRAGYGEQLVEEVARVLTQEYGQGFSARNLWDMNRFYAEFRILQALPAKSSETKICQPLAGKSTNAPILQAVSVELPDQSSRSRIDQTPPDQMQSSNRQTPSSEFLPHRILPTLSGESLEKKSEARRHRCLHW
jgi:hypothetical protein